MPPNSNKGGNRTEYHYWDYFFHWTDQHISGSDFKPWIRKCDTLADECNVILDEKDSIASSDNRNAFKKDRYALLREHHESDAKLEELWTQAHTVPEWVDWDQIERGQKVFWRYVTPIRVALIFHSLVGGMGGTRVIETLSRTGGFCAKVVQRRLLETLQYVIEVHDSLEAIKPGGDGHLACIRVRLLHSAVRLKIMSLVEKDPTYYDVEKYGLPINDLDSYATIHTFSSLLVWVGLPRQGIHLNDREFEDYIALWRLVGYYMGAPTLGFENAASAKAAAESLLLSEYGPADTGRMLARNIIIGTENKAPAYASKEYMYAMTRLVNGEQLSDELHIPRTSLFYASLVWGYCIWAQIETRVFANIPFVQRSMLAFSRMNMWKSIMDEKKGLGKKSVFDFKYIPALKRTTRPGKPMTYRFKRPGIEVLSYLGLLAAFVLPVCLAAGIYFLAPHLTTYVNAFHAMVL